MKGWSVAAAVLLMITASGCMAGEASETPSTAVKDCGTENYGHGEGYDAAARNCIIAAHRDKVAARFVSTALTIEGDPIRLELVTGADGKVKAVHDTRADKFGDQKLYTYTCSTLELVARPNDRGLPGFHLSRCKGSGKELGTW